MFDYSLEMEIKGKQSIQVFLLRYEHLEEVITFTCHERDIVQPSHDEVVRCVHVLNYINHELDNHMHASLKFTFSLSISF